MTNAQGGRMSNYNPPPPESLVRALQDTVHYPHCARCDEKLDEIARLRGCIGLFSTAKPDMVTDA